MRQRPSIIFSVVVATHDRQQLLQKCLASLASQSLSQKMFEVIVIDNNSSDNTSVVIKNYYKKITNFSTIFESKEGLGLARQIGANNAKRIWLAYIDDDACADPNWLKNAKIFINRYNSASAFGGPYDRYCNAQIPDWFPKEYGVLNHGTEIKKLDLTDNWLTGSNFFVKTSVLKKIGGFDGSLGMRGKSLGYGEETQVLVKIKNLGLSIFYVPSIKVTHNLAEKKLSLKWMLKYSYTTGTFLLRSHNKKPSFGFYTLKLIYGLKRSMMSLCSYRPIPIKRRIYYTLAPLLSWLGSMRELIIISNQLED